MVSRRGFFLSTLVAAGVSGAETASTASFSRKGMKSSAINFLHTSVYARRIWEVTKDEWLALAQVASSVGKNSDAADIRYIASILPLLEPHSLRVSSRGTHSTNIAPNNVVTTIAKKALIQLLKYGRDKIPVKIRPYADKIVYVLEDVETFQVATLTTAFSQMGIPPVVAQEAAEFVVFFLRV